MLVLSRSVVEHDKHFDTRLSQFILKNLSGIIRSNRLLSEYIQILITDFLLSYGKYSPDILMQRKINLSTKN